jgi:hypothetical protein
MGIYLLIAIFLYTHTHILWNDINNQLIDHSDSLLIKFRNVILAKFIKYIKLYFYFVNVKKRKDQNEPFQRIRI